MSLFVHKADTFRRLFFNSHDLYILSEGKHKSFFTVRSSIMRRQNQKTLQFLVLLTLEESVKRTILLEREKNKDEIVRGSVHRL